MSSANDTTKRLSHRTKDQLIGDLVQVREELDVLRQLSDGLRQSATRYHELFEQSPIGIREEDFSDARAKIEDWRSDGVRDFRRITMRDAVYATGWDGTVVVEATAGGTYQVTTASTTSPSC